MIMATWHYCK